MLGRGLTIRLECVADVHCVTFLVPERRAVELPHSRLDGSAVHDDLDARVEERDKQGKGND